jgi:thymidylate kinase
MSALFLFGLFVDCWLGYLLTTGPLVARSGLVIFDRYFHDVLIDPKRYRYGGPQWLTKLLCLLAPPAKPLFLVLDANEEVIFGRKQELPIDELKRQRKAYLEFAARYSSAVVVDCNDAKRASANVFCAVRVYVSRRSRTIPLTTRYDSTH